MTHLEWLESLESYCRYMARRIKKSAPQSPEVAWYVSKAGEYRKQIRDFLEKK